MADLYGKNNASSSSLEPDDMSLFLQNLLQNSTASASGSAAQASAGTFCRSGIIISQSEGRLREGASASLNFSDPGGFFAAETKEGISRGFFAAGDGDREGITSSMKGTELQNHSDGKVDSFLFGCEGSEVSEMPPNHVQPRSSKRSRSAEVHNLSEKRRRSRINEKLKALQNLIPNSNKTDKASMLDEAIEYLKQLQLQVQMLTMRNGLSLYPGFLPGSFAPNRFDDGNILQNLNSGPDNDTSDMQNQFQVSNHDFSSQPAVMPDVTYNSNLESSFRLEPSIQNPYGHIPHLASSKEVCRDNMLSRLHLEGSCSGNNSSSEVSS